MKQYVVAACAALTLVAGPVFAEEATTATAEKATTATAVAKDERAAKIEATLKGVGATEEQTKKYLDLSKQMMEARQGGDREKSRALREERDKVLTPEQNEKVQAEMRGQWGGRRGGEQGEQNAEQGEKKSE